MQYLLSYFALFFMLSSVSQASPPLEQILHEIPKFQAAVEGLKLDDGKNIMDVHVFNSHMKPHAAFFNRCNACLFSAEIFAPNQVLTEMIALRAANPELKLPDISKEVTKLRGYLVKLSLDGETGMQISDMLSAMWNYMRGPIHPDRRDEFIKLLYEKMLENTKQKGGCFPGYAGRLMQVNQFCILSQYTFIMREREMCLLLEGHNPETKVEDDVERAMALSLQDQSKKDKEEADFVKVLHLSQKGTNLDRLKEQSDLDKAILLSQTDSTDPGYQLALLLSQEDEQVEADRLLAEKLSKE